MALSADDAAKLQQKLQEIERLSRLLGANINTINLQPIEENAGAIEAIFQRLTNQARGLGEETDYLVSNFQKLIGEIKNSGTGIGQATKGLRSLSSITEQISSYQKGYNNLSSKEIARLKDKVKIETDRLKRTKDTLKEEGLEISRKIRYGNLGPRQLQIELEKLNKISIARRNIRQLLQNEDITLGELNTKLAESEKEAKRIEKALGLTGRALKGISKIPILGDLVDTKEALIAAEEAAKNGAGKMGTMGAAMGSLGKSLVESLTDPLTVIGLAVKLFMELVKLGFKASTEVTAIGKSMALSVNESRAVRDHMLDLTAESKNFNDSLYIGFNTLENQLQALAEMQEAFGATRGFTDQQLRDQIYLTKQLGLAADEAAGLQQLAMANGKTADDVVLSVTKQTGALMKQKGIQLDNKKILGEVAKVSGQLRLQYQNNPDLIAKAVVQTQKLGVTLEQAAKASSHLLNFEESIEDQISAELLTGKQLNLERARLLALNGDVAGSMEEMLSQVGSAAEFSQMNVLQQEQLAKAVGMTADELANSLIQQENLNRLGKETKKQIQDKVEELKKQGRIEEANNLLRQTGNAEEAKRALEQIDTQTKFNALIEKVKSLLGGLVGGEMEKLLTGMVEWLGKTENVKWLVQSIKEGFEMVKSVISAIYNFTKMIKDHWKAIVGFMLGGPVGLIIGAAADYFTSDKTTPPSSNTEQISDGVISDGLVVGKYNKGQIQPIAQGAPNDNVIFTTNKPIANNNNNTSININALIEEQRRTNALLERQNNISNTIANKNTVLQYDSQQAGTVADIGSYQISSQNITN